MSFYYYKCHQILPLDIRASQSKHSQEALDLLRLSFMSQRTGVSERGIFPVGVSYGAWKLLQRNTPEKQELVRRDWKLNYLIASLWVYLNWNDSEVLNTILDESIYGSEWRGISIASIEFFGVEVADLKPEELAVLVANTKYNSKYDPWCNREEVHAEASRLLREYSKARKKSIVQVNSDAMFSRLKERSASCTN